MNANTYMGDDNLPHCAICNKPLMRYSEEKKSFFPTRCDCYQHKAEEEKKQKFIEEQRKFRTLQKASMLGERYKNASFENTCLVSDSFNKALERCKNFCKNADEILKRGWGMYIYGASGVGKTHLTACMSNELIKNQKHCLFTNFFEISKAIRDTFNNRDSDVKLINKISEVDFLFIDDIGTERLRSNGEDNWLQEQVFDIINKRYNNIKPTIFTSNHSIRQLVEERGLMEKTADRIDEMSKRVIEIKGNSYRRKKANESNELF